MGCDIHLYVEKKVDGAWKSADRWSNADWDEDCPNRLEVAYKNRFYTSRNYNLFGMLANARNGRGFAGIKTGEGFNPIAMPKGLPVDVSPEVQAESDYWDGDGHSHSWLTVQELLDYDWSQATEHQGWVEAGNFATWKYTGKPFAWSGEIDGPRVTKVSNEDMDRAIAFGHTQNLYTLVKWQESYRDSAREFLEETLPQLQALGASNEVRIVFWFDN